MKGTRDGGASGPLCERARTIRRIDSHAHISHESTKKAIALMDEWGISRAINVSGGSRKKIPGSAAVKDETEGRILFFCNIDFYDWETDAFVASALESLEKCKEMGGMGLKIFKGLGLGLTYDDGRLVPVDDPILDPIFDRCGEMGFPVLIHSGDPKAFFEPPTKDNERYAELEAHPSWSFHGDEYPSWDELYRQFENRIARHPSTIFIGAHFGNNPEDPERVFRMVGKYPNFYIDTAARVPEIGRFDAVRMRELFTKHQDRILFGTDVGIAPDLLILGSSPPWEPSRKQIEHFFAATWRYFESADRQFEHPTPIQGDWEIDGIGLPCGILEKIYHGNVERLLGLEGGAS
jgi:predicted TIM-barrel fold metal-dependent hydrolase